jgi:hypothetical protein
MEEGRIDAADVHDEPSQASAHASWSNLTGLTPAGTTLADDAQGRQSLLGAVFSSGHFLFWDADMDDDGVTAELRGFYIGLDCASIAGFLIPEECECLMRAGPGGG